MNAITKWFSFFKYDMLGRKSIMTNFATRTVVHKLCTFLSSVSVTELTYKRFEESPRFCLHTIYSIHVVNV